MRRNELFRDFKSDFLQIEENSLGSDVVDKPSDAKLVDEIKAYGSFRNSQLNSKVFKRI